MIRPYQFAAIAATAAIMLAACGGGGSSSAPQLATPAKTAVTPAPAAASRPVVGHATLSITYPKALRATSSGRIVRPIHSADAGRASAAGTKRPQFVDPLPNPNASPGPNAGAPLMDIYVDGSLLSNLDNNGEISDSLIVNNNSGDGTQQNITLPLFATGGNQIVVIEYDYNHQNVLAIGETNIGPFIPGTGVQGIVVTLLMNAKLLAVFDQKQMGMPQLMDFGTYFQPAYIGCCNTVANGFNIFETDASGAFLAVAGVGGTALPPTISSSVCTGVSCTTKLVNSSTAGIYLISFDNNTDPLVVDAIGNNPASAIYSDVINNGGQYPGIFNLVQSQQFNLALIANGQVSGEITFTTQGS